VIYRCKSRIPGYEMLDQQPGGNRFELRSGLDERFCEVMDAAPVMIWVSGLDKGCIWFNRPWLTFTGRSMSQELGDGWTEGVHPDDFERCLDTHIGHFDARREFRMQYRLRRHDGAYRWIDGSGIPRHDRSGKFLGYIGSCVDITHLKETEASRRESELRLRFALQAAQMGTFEADIAGTHAIIDAQGARLLGLSEETRTVSVDQLRKYIPLEDLHASDAKQKRMTEMGEPYRHEFRLSLPDGSERWLSAHADVRSNRIFGVNFDITHRKAAEDALRESEARLRVATSAAALGVFEWDPVTDHVVWEDERIYEGFGLARGDRPINKQEFVDKYLYAADVPGFEAALKEAMRTQGNFHTVCRIRRRRTFAWLQIDGKFETSTTRGSSRLIGVVAVITARKRLEARAARLSEQLLTVQEEERRNIAQELHDSTVQHLVAVDLTTMNLRSRQRPKNKDAEEWDVIDASLKEAMKQLRTFSYLLVPPALQPHGLYKSLEQYTDGFADRTGIRITLRLDGHARKLPMRSQRVIFRVVQEALANIYRHAHASEASVELRQIGQKLHLTIRDNGRGIVATRKDGQRRVQSAVGIRGMRMRLDQVGGSLRISRLARGGTKVRAVLPVCDGPPNRPA
jgi:PAS domain S-box-containing protein